MQYSRPSHLCLAVILAFLVLAPVLCFSPQVTNAQTPTAGSVLVYPDAQSPLYGSIGHNWTITFEARYFNNGTDQPVSNATVEFKVYNAQGKQLNTFDCNTTQGTFSFNYTSNTPAVLTFTPTKLVMQDKTEWNVEHPERDSVVPYLSATVYWDTFSVALVNSTTDNLGAATFTVNVTRLLIPTGTISTYGGEIINSVVDDANVTINGVEAQKTAAPGVYTAYITTAFPTAYTLVTVAHENWRTTQTAFSPTHSANLKIWLVAVGAVAASVGVCFLAFKLRVFRANRNSKLPFLGGVFLLFAACISIYWAAIGFEAVLHGFDWLVFAGLEACCFLLGTVTALFAMKRKNQAAVIFAVPVLLIVNSIMAMSSLGGYGLPTPWLFVASAILCCAASFLCVAKADEEFAKVKRIEK
jgi:hypothetical protein